MAIKIDRVYSTVQRLLNIEQRGQMPSLDFNDFALLAQRDLFDKLFKDRAHFMASPKGIYSTIPMELQEKIDIFIVNRDLVYDTPNTNFTLQVDPEDVVYNILDVYLTEGSDTRIIEHIDHKKSRYIMNSGKMKPSVTYPKYKRFRSDAKGVGVIEVYPSTIVSGVSMDYVRTPSDPQWVGVTVFGTEMFNEGNSNDFDLHPSMFDDLVDKILFYGGTSIRQVDVANAAITDMQGDQTIDKQ